MATRQIVLGSIKWNNQCNSDLLLPVCKPTVRILTLISRVYSIRSALTVGGRYAVQNVSREKEDDTFPCQDSTYQCHSLWKLSPQSHIPGTSLADMDLRHTKEGAMWKTGYVKTVNLRSHMPNHEDAVTNTRSAINNGSSQWLTFGNINPEHNRKPKVLYENDPSFPISLYKTPLA